MLSLSVSSPQVSLSPISVSCCSRISPVSIPSSIIMVVTPVMRSPEMIACAIGAEPLCFGSREAWTLIFPNNGISRISLLRICPKAAVTHRSGRSSRSVSTASLRIFSGWNTGMPDSAAAIFTGHGSTLFPRPFGLSGWVKTPATSAPGNARRTFNAGTAKSGVPIKTILTADRPPEYGLLFLPGSVHDP